MNYRCKRLNGLGLHSMVLSKASQKTFSIKAKNWSESAHRFLKQCADSGNVEACYTLGMVSIYLFISIYSLPYICMYMYVCNWLNP